MCAAFNSAPGSNTFPTFTGSIDQSSLSNNPINKPINILSDVYLTQGSKLGRAGFSAYANVDQTGVANETFTKVNFGAAIFNDSSLYNTALSRWTPPAGRCQIIANVFVAGGTLLGTPLTIAITKNGSMYRQTTGATLAAWPGAQITIIDACNGTDYYEIQIHGYSSSTLVVVGIQSMTYFMGSMI